MPLGIINTLRSRSSKTVDDAMVNATAAETSHSEFGRRLRCSGAHATLAISTALENVYSLFDHIEDA